MPISRVDYETPTPETVEPTAVASKPVDALAILQPLIQQVLRTETAPPDEAPPESTPQPSEVSPPLEKQPAPVSVAPPDDEQHDDNAPSSVEPGRNLKNRIDTVRGRSQNQNQGSADWQALLDQAVTLLENVATHPALTDYGSLKDRLDNVEQIVNSSGNVR